MIDDKTTKIVIHADERIAQINPNIYGHFAEHLGSCIYDGIWVGPESDIPNDNGIRLDVVEALKKIKVPIIRWPGGCFADTYHWKDGIGPRMKRPVRPNIWWGAEESNKFGTHEFMQLCHMLGSEPYICANLGSSTPQEMMEWLEYLNYEGDTTLTRLRAKNGHPEPFGIRFLGIGNESWGCGGNMTPQYYANEFARFATFANYPGSYFLIKIASGSNNDDYEWTRRFFDTIAGRACGCKQSRLPLLRGFAFHYYCGTAGSATKFNEAQWYELLEKAMFIEEILIRHRLIMDDYDPQRHIELICDEWGTWHPAESSNPMKKLYQQNTLRDAVVAALTLDIFNRHADKITMSNIAQMINVLQSMILTDGPKMVVTPTYHVYEMFAPHQAGISVPIRIKTTKISTDNKSLDTVAGSCSLKGKQLTLSIVNIDPKKYADVDVEIRGIGESNLTRWRVLTGDIHGHNTFDEPETILPSEKSVTDKKLLLDPASINVFTYELENS